MQLSRFGRGSLISLLLLVSVLAFVPPTGASAATYNWRISANGTISAHSYNITASPFSAHCALAGSTSGNTGGCLVYNKFYSSWLNFTCTVQVTVTGWNTSQFNGVPTFVFTSGSVAVSTSGPAVTAGFCYGDMPQGTVDQNTGAIIAPIYTRVPAAVGSYVFIGFGQYPGVGYAQVANLT